LNNLINQLFANLDTWRHFPAYQLERRADIFFSIYLSEYLEVEHGYDVQSIIPEFPLRVGTLHSGLEHVNKSYKADYLVKLKNPSRVIFIELKTDNSSRRPKQDDYLQAAHDSGMQSLLSGLRSIYRATSSKEKYRHLLRELEHANLIRNICDDNFDILDETNPIEIIYLQPTGESKDVINFNQFATFVGKKQDELSQRFSTSLREWAIKTAGANERITRQTTSLEESEL
jgi:hypothetical protein